MRSRDRRQPLRRPQAGGDGADGDRTGTDRAGGDPYGFTVLAERHAGGLRPAGGRLRPESGELGGDEQRQQASRGHRAFRDGPGPASELGHGWIPGHRVDVDGVAGPPRALLDPTIQWIGIAAYGAYWTFNAY